VLTACWDTKAWPTPNRLPHRSPYREPDIRGDAKCSHLSWIRRSRDGEPSDNPGPSAMNERHYGWGREPSDPTQFTGDAAWVDGFRPRLPGAIAPASRWLSFSLCGGDRLLTAGGRLSGGCSWMRCLFLYAGSQTSSSSTASAVPITTAS
jgi:hypothetical protein